MTTIRDKNGRFAKGCKFWLGKKRDNIRELMSEIKKGIWTGSKNPRWKGGEIQKTCLNCGKKYFIRRYAIKISKFCSRSCKSSYIHSGSKNNHWKGGISKERDKLKHSEAYKIWRSKVFKRDRWTCRWCGHRSKKSDIEAHHIETIEDNPKLCLKEGNGITLCETCHKKTYGKEEKFAKVFKEILRDFMSNKEKS